MIKRRTEEETIDGIKVITTQYGLQEACQLQATLAKLVLPMLAKLPDGVTMRSIGGMDLRVFGAAVSAITEQLSEVELWKLLTRILRSTQVVDDTGKMVELNTSDRIEAAIAEPPTLYKIVWFALVVNFRSSFSAVSNAPAIETSSPPPATVASP